MRTTIKRIRKKFLAIDPAFKEIETYVAFGYRQGLGRYRARIAGGLPFVFAGLLSSPSRIESQGR